MKKLLVMVLAIVSFGLILPLTVNAACDKTGQVIRMYDSATSSTAYILTSSLAGVYYYTYTTDSDLRDALRNCQNNDQKCYVSGAASACPTTGSARDMGTTNTVTVNP